MNNHDSSFKATAHWLLVGILCCGIIYCATRVSSQLAFLAISTPSRTSSLGRHEREEKQKVKEGEENDRFHGERNQKASRKIRISKGSGTSVQDINKLLKQFKKMSQMMKKVGKNREIENMMKSGQMNDISSLLNKNKPF